MDDHEHVSDESFLDSWARFSPIERECFQHIDHEETLVDREHEQERNAAIERLWATFQDTASSLAHLYKERPLCDCCDQCTYNRNQPHERYWQQFQGAANKVTSLYRDGSEGIRAGFEFGYKAGYKKRNKDLANWLRKKKRSIRREDILLNLSGHSPPRRKVNDSVRTISPNHDLTMSPESNGEFDFLNDSRIAEGRKRHTEFNLFETPHKRNKFS
ncbi:HUWE1-associated protein modifying stress responses 1 [Hydra vulgaris]|uniref:HUWE1-associated protein modifying stress responses 1 n=2 Tax=Hydra vulgaris TaxID=6087 RepID=A0ABM4CAX2_HYDVU|nr:telomere attrition and p53 response 1 protein [Hydra vulgaris]